MGFPVEFKGQSHDFGPPIQADGTPREDVGRLPCFLNGKCVVSCWQLTESEWKDIELTRQVWISIMSGTVVLPHYVGSLRATAAIVADLGKIW